MTLSLILKDTAPENIQLFRVRIVTVLCLLVALGLLILFAHYFIGYTLKPVEKSRKQQTEFVSAASHELRSPLAVISAGAGAIKKGTLEEAREYADKIEAECARLSRLTGDLLKLASVDSGSWQMKLSEINPETVIIGMAERSEDLAAQRSIRLEIHMEEILFPILHVDEQRIEQALTILMDNALGYTPTRGTIHLGTYVQRKNVYFTVTDSGPGVPDGDKERIFDRFYRGDSARTDKEHFGIGLSVAKEIALLHKGNLSVHDAAGGGAQFRLKLPY
ncbi:HAMP domain-containing sensor histidine kinase [Oscillospiraceae bacterium MB08-C2-2]|nr:HAMP domain-containing sensor histidine kinase [Oscillospiraceae bacterium MB08-C2-2]